MNADYNSVEQYIASQPDAAQSALHRVRRAICKAVPQAEETISYKMPTYRLHGERMLFFAGWKRHYSLYPATKHIIATFKQELAPYEISKGTIRFRLSEAVPVKLIERIAKFRAKEVSQRKHERSKTA